MHEKVEVPDSKEEQNFIVDKIKEEEENRINRENKPVRPSLAYFCRKHDSQT